MRTQNPILTLLKYCVITVFCLPVAYVILGAPAGGILRLIIDHAPTAYREDLAVWWLNYRMFYKPLVVVSQACGFFEVVDGYWKFFGWDLLAYDWYPRSKP